MQAKQNVSSSTFEPEKHWTQSNVMYLHVWAMVLIMCQ